MTDTDLNSCILFRNFLIHDYYKCIYMVILYILNQIIVNVYLNFYRQHESLPQFKNSKSLDRSRTFVKSDNHKDDSGTMLRAEDVKEEFLVCSICTREFDEDAHVPRILPCLHSFCQLCLKKIVKAKSIECPLCKQDHELPKGGISGLAKDTTRRNLIDFIKVRKRSSEILCKDCPEDQTATDFCKECYIFMCPDCTNAHKRSLASRKHSVLTIKELQNSGMKYLVSISTCIVFFEFKKKSKV